MALTIRLTLHAKCRVKLKLTHSSAVSFHTSTNAWNTLSQRNNPKALSIWRKIWREQ